MEVSDQLSAWAKSVSAYAQSELERGKEIPGYKLVARRSLRKWASEGAAIEHLKKVLGEEAYTIKVISPAQAEKKLKKLNNIDEKEYIASYVIKPDGGVTRLSLLTGEYFVWLPILATALVISIAANIILITYDRYWLREIIQIILTVIGVAVVANLVSVFPFDFSVLPNTTAIHIAPVVVTIVLIIIAVGLGVGALVRFINLIVSVVKQSPS